VSNLVFEEELGCVESVIANYAGDHNQMNYDLWDVTVYDVVVE